MKKYFFSIILSISLMLSCLFLSSPTSAISTSTTASVNVAEACTMYADITTPHTAIVSPNTYETDIGITTINVICNDPSGYAIYAVGYTGNTIGDTNSTKLVSTDGNNTINTGTATSGSASNWAMKLATSGSSYVATLDNSFGNYHAVPSDYTKVAHYNSATDAGSNATGSTLTTTYAAFVTGNQSAGTYLGKVKYTMVHPASETAPHEVACTAGKICYNANTSIVEGQMGQQTPSTYDLNNGIILWASNFKKQGYGFAGWSDKYDYETNEDANFYGPNETITAPSDISTNGLSLYAVWIPSQGSIQSESDALSVCRSLTQADPNATRTLDSVSALTDDRDNNTYAIAKLADDQCWMIENLRLADKDSNNNDINLSLSNTNGPSLPLTNSWWYSSANNNDPKPTSNKLSASTNPTTSSWCQTNSANCHDQSMLYSGNVTDFASNTSSTQSSNIYSYGNTYNWYSATAGHGTNSKIYDDTGGDICPVNWRLPAGEASEEIIPLDDEPGDFKYLNTILSGSNTAALASNNLRAYPNNFIFSGYILGSSISGRGSVARYWSSSAFDDGNACQLFLNKDYVFPGVNGNSKQSGHTVRCVFNLK